MKPTPPTSLAKHCPSGYWPACGPAGEKQYKPLLETRNKLGFLGILQFQFRPQLSASQVTCRGFLQIARPVTRRAQVPLCSRHRFHDSLAVHVSDTKEVGDIVDYISSVTVGQAVGKGAAC